MNTSQVPITDSRNWQLFLLFTPQSTKKKKHIRPAATDKPILNRS